MQRTRLVFHSISEIVGSDGLSVILLADTTGDRVLSVICDKAMTTQIALRLNNVPGCDTFLPEVLLQMLLTDGRSADDFELMVYGVEEGQYKVSLLNKLTLTLRTIRMSDAVLLSFMASIPIFINEALMQQQSTPYQANRKGISIPINTIDLDHLNRELQKAISEENYRLAAHLHDEITKRKEKP